MEIAPVFMPEMPARYRQPWRDMMLRPSKQIRIFSGQVESLAGSENTGSLEACFRRWAGAWCGAVPAAMMGAWDFPLRTHQVFTGLRIKMKFGRIGVASGLPTCRGHILIFEP